MVCPFKRNKITEIIYDYDLSGHQEPTQEITKIEFGECDELKCPFYRVLSPSCLLRGGNHE